MASAVVIKRDCAVKTGRSVCEPDMSYLHRFNDVGGRPDERLGTKGAFLPGVQVMAGGPARDVPLDAEIHPGNVLHTFPGLKPDMSGEARTNVVGGRPGERLGSRGGFTPGVKTWCGGELCDVPLDAEVHPGNVLHTFPGLKPDMSGEARTNVVGGRPGERLGSRGGFTPGIKTWCGGKPRDVPLDAEVHPGNVLHTFPGLKPDTSGEARTNVVGGRPGERLGSRGGFTPGIKTWCGGEPRDVPLDAEVHPGNVLHTFPGLKPDTSGEARTNVVGGRPGERLGSRGGFVRRIRAWSGGEPRDVPAGREVLDHGIVLHRVMRDRQLNDRQLNGQPAEELFCGEGDEVSKVIEDDFLDIEESGSLDVVVENQPLMAAPTSDGSAFRRCGSESKFPMGDDLVSGPFTAF